MDPAFREVIATGAIGAILVLAMLGWVEFKPVIDERKQTIKELKEIITKLSDGLEKATDMWEAERAAHHGGKK